MGSVERDALTDEQIRDILKRYKTVAVVGMSKDPAKPGHYVPKFLMEHGYRVIPVNPTVSEILGMKSYRNLLEIPEPVEIVDVFRRPEDVPPHAREALAKGVKVFWMQEGIHNKEAEDILRKAGITVVFNRCMMKEYSRLFGSKPRVSLREL